MRLTQKLCCSLSAFFTLLLLTFTLLPIARAQETTGAIQGTVTDPTGASVGKGGYYRNKQPTHLHHDHPYHRSGYYRLTTLPPGTYTLIVTAPGFAERSARASAFRQGVSPPSTSPFL